MKILFLGPYYNLLKDNMEEHGDTVVSTENPIILKDITGYDFIVSFGYRYIIKPDILKYFNKKAINLHISYLPWNRGADPNLWSFLEDTAKGVSIHYINEGIDTGDIIAQRKVPWFLGDTLKTTYNRLMDEILILFREKWPLIRCGQVTASAQTEKGTYHKSDDKKSYEYLLINGWDTTVEDVLGKGCCQGGKEL